MSKFYGGGSGGSSTVAISQSTTDNNVVVVAPTSINHGIKTVATAGTSVALAASTTCRHLVVQAQTDNTGKIAVGASGVSAVIASGTGILLEPGDAFEMDISNLSLVYIDSTVNGDGVRYTYFS